MKCDFPSNGYQVDLRCNRLIQRCLIDGNARKLFDCHGTFMFLSSLPFSISRCANQSIQFFCSHFPDSTNPIFASFLILFALHFPLWHNSMAFLLAFRKKSELFLAGYEREFFVAFVFALCLHSDALNYETWNICIRIFRQPEIHGEIDGNATSEDFLYFWCKMFIPKLQLFVSFCITLKVLTILQIDLNSMKFCEKLPSSGDWRSTAERRTWIQLGIWIYDLCITSAECVYCVSLSASSAHPIRNLRFNISSLQENEFSRKKSMKLCSNSKKMEFDLHALYSTIILFVHIYLGCVCLFFR